MTMRTELAEEIRNIMNAKVCDIEDAIDDALNKMDSIFDKIEEAVFIAKDDLEDIDNLESVQNDLYKLYNEI